MKYLKIKIKKTKDAKDDSVTHYDYEGLDSLEFNNSYMLKDEKYLICEIENDEHIDSKVQRITKEEFDKLKDI